MNEERKRRFAQNEALYRDINERIETLTRTLVADEPATMNVICECGFLDCARQIPVSVAEYERIRKDPTWFLVLPGHESAEVEVVVEEHAGFNIVCKDKPEGREVALETDPRADE